LAKCKFGSYRFTTPVLTIAGTLPTIMKNIILILFLSLSSVIFGQNLNGKYSGSWATTNWYYEFDGKGNFEFITAGHFGFTNTKGKYEIKGDTVYLNAKKTGKGTLDIKDKMLIDKDSCIIDLHMRYDYCKSRKSKFLNSNKRNFRFPQTIAKNPKRIADLKNVIFKPYFEFKELNFQDVKIGKKRLEFKESDLPKFYIEVIEINQANDFIEVEFKIKDEGVNFTMHYELLNGEWILDYERHHEK